MLIIHCLAYGVKIKLISSFCLASLENLKAEGFKKTSFNTAYKKNVQIFKTTLITSRE